MYDDFYSALEQGRIEPITLWKDKVSKWTWEEQTRLEIELIGKVAKEEREGRYGSDLHRYAMQLANYISQQSNYQRQREQEQQTLSTDADILQMPIELATPQAMEIWDKAKKAGWINDDYSFNGTKYQMAYAAEIMGKALGLKPKWKPFISLWKYKYFAQTRRESVELIGRVERDKDIEATFSL